jgi:hypothetical protein
MTVVALLLTACRAEVADPAVEPLPEPWAAAAVDRFADELAAAHTGVSDFASYFAPTVVLDSWSGLGAVAGRDRLRDLLAVTYGSTFEELHLHAGYVDRAAALVQLRLDRRTGFTGPVEVLEFRRYRPAGVASAHTLVALDDLRRHPAATGRPGFATIEALGRRYRAFWSGADQVAASDLYTPRARITDTVEGLALTGSPDIAAYVAAGRADGPRQVRPTDIPGGTTVAAYLSGRDPSAIDRVAFVVDVDHGDRCPGREALLLELDDGRIAGERRFHDIDDIRRCRVAPPSGWWDQLREPPALDAVTGRLDIDGQVVVLRGSSPALDGLVRWAMERFPLGGLEAPRLASVTFATATGRCDGISGTVVPARRGGGNHVLLCLSESEACVGAHCDRYTFAGRATALHEFAHAWDLTWLDAATRHRYQEATQLHTWFGGERPWAERAGERAAEVLMWGLLDHEVPLVRLDDPACEQLRSEFRLLTGRDPERETCPGQGSRATATGSS